ncbi:DUF3087 family protein [Thalassotalea ganghwensis]
MKNIDINTINKAVYRKNLNMIIVGFIATFALLSVAFGAIFIHFFGITLAESLQGETNFRFNLLGVILALLACAAILHSLKHSDFFKEVYFVWQLKQINNQIYRKLKSIKSAAMKDDITALTILKYYFSTQISLLKLDDNTITIGHLEKELAAVERQIQSKDLSIDITDFNKQMLDNF